jgi:hypothetical protein
METFPTLAGILHPVLWLVDGCQLEDLSLAYDKPFPYTLHGAVLLMHLTPQSYLSR